MPKTRTERLSGIIFDMDGVLINTPKYNWYGLTEVFGKYGVEFEPEEITKFLGRPLILQFAYVTARYGVRGLTYTQFKSRYDYVITKAIASEPVEAMPGAHELVLKLRMAGVPIAVATSSLRERADRFLGSTKLMPLFDAVITMEDVKKYKPDPEIFLTAARRIGADPSRVVVIEDAANGVAAARAGKLWSVGLMSQFQTALDLQDADVIVDSLRELNVRTLRSLVNSD